MLYLMRLQRPSQLECKQSYQLLLVIVSACNLTMGRNQPLVQMACAKESVQNLNLELFVHLFLVVFCLFLGVSKNF